MLSVPPRYRIGAAPSDEEAQKAAEKLLRTIFNDESKFEILVRKLDGSKPFIRVAPRGYHDVATVAGNLGVLMYWYTQSPRLQWQLGGKAAKKVTEQEGAAGRARKLLKQINDAEPLARQQMLASPEVVKRLRAMLFEINDEYWHLNRADPYERQNHHGKTGREVARPEIGIDNIVPLVAAIEMYRNSKAEDGSARPPFDTDGFMKAIGLSPQAFTWDDLVELAYDDGFIPNDSKEQPYEREWRGDYR